MAHSPSLAPFGQVRQNFVMSASPRNQDVSPALDREHDRPHALQIELYRRATPTEKLAAVARLNATVIALKDASLRSRFPETPTQTRREMVRRWWPAARD